MTLSEKQRLFTRNFMHFLVWAHAKGYEFTFGEAYRSDEQAEINAIGPVGRAQVATILKNYHIANLATKIENNMGSGVRGTLHEIRLAVDMNLFIDGKYITDSEAWRPLGEYWKSLHPLNRWGGDFKDKLGRSKPDGNHISMEHEGRK